MTAIGRPQNTSAAISVRISRSDRLDDIAKIAPISPPKPSAALSSPRPGWPMPSSSIAATTTSALSSPRVSAWPYVPSIDQARTGRRRIARIPSVSRSPPPAWRPPPEASAACSNRRPGGDHGRHEEGRRRRATATSGVQPGGHQDAGNERPAERAEPFAGASRPCWRRRTRLGSGQWRASG